MTPSARSNPAETAALDQARAKAAVALRKCTSFVLIVEYEEGSGAGELIGSCDTEFTGAAAFALTERLLKDLLGGATE